MGERSAPPDPSRPAPGATVGTSPASVRQETLTDAVARLASAGYRGSFLAREGRLTSIETEQHFAPEDLVVCEVVRFEGDSDPGDMTVLFAMQTSDGSVRGTFVAGYGTATDAESAAVVARLEANHAAGKTRQRERARH
jgi:hypothetical protein